MTIQLLLRGLRQVAVGCAAALLVAGTASAHGGFGGGGFGGGGHGGGGGFHGGGFHGGGFHGGGFHGGGWHGGGWHGGYGGGWRGGYGRYGYGYGGWGWGYPWLGAGLWLGALPFYSSELWWDGVPYYYADDNYYVWNGSADAYQSVEPPAQVVQEARTAQGATHLYAYPKNGQSPGQQAQDKQECEHWAAGQTGLASTVPGAAASGTPLSPGTSSDPYTDRDLTAAQREQYLRAEGACLQGRGYSVD